MTNLAALLFDVARRIPDRPAVSDDRSSRTYRELTERVARLAGGLRAQGLAPGDRVLLSLENCGEFFELLFGCWAAGLCAVPANARLHPREVEFIAEDSGARLLVATQVLAEALAPLAGAVASLDRVVATRSAEYDGLFGEPLGAELVQQARRTLDIREEERDSAGREGSHASIMRRPPPDRPTARRSRVR